MHAGMDMSDMTEWLLGHINETVMILKEEDGDTDQVMLNLKKVTYREGQPEADDYVNDTRLVLHGEGKIAVDGAGGAAELPRESYEISLAGQCSASLQGEELLIRTERATIRVGAVRQ